MYVYTTVLLVLDDYLSRYLRLFNSSIGSRLANIRYLRLYISSIGSGLSLK